MPPGEAVPTGGFNDQVTVVLPGTLSDEVSCSCPEARITGITDTAGDAADKIFRVTIVCPMSRITVAANKRFEFIL
jgi:hypothetical protein